VDGVSARIQITVAESDRSIAAKTPQAQAQNTWLEPKTHRLFRARSIAHHGTDKRVWGTGHAPEGYTVDQQRVLTE